MTQKLCGKYNIPEINIINHYEFDVYILIVQVLDQIKDQDKWNNILFNINNELDYIRLNKTNYVFIFDLYKIDILPVKQIYEIQNLLQEKVDILKKHLLCSIIFTNNKAFEIIIKASMILFPPNKALKIIYDNSCNDSNNNKYKIPSTLWTQTMLFIKNSI
tara:strand:- start:4 stop:486 length:483 start_codon:yes stop_codon:yes gene_type:complete